MIDDLTEVVIEQQAGGKIDVSSTKNLFNDLNTVGYVGEGYHTARLAWPKLHSQFVVGGVPGTGNHKKSICYPTLGRTPDNLLVLQPVDLLILDSVTIKDYLPTVRNPKGT